MSQTQRNIMGGCGTLFLILVIAAIVFPFFARAHGRSGRSCLSNMRYLGMIISQYANNYDGALPNIADAKSHKNTWRTAIYRQMQSNVPYQCPDRNNKANELDGIPRSYAANYSGNYNGTHFDKGGGAFAGPNSVPVNLSDFREASNTIMLCEVDRSDRPEFNIDDTADFGPSHHVL